jgi:hypothetical protein
MFRVPKPAFLSSLLLLAAIPLTAVNAADGNAHRPRGVNWSDTLWVPAYDPDQGVPLAVSLRYQRWTISQASVENPTRSPCAVQFTHSVNLELALQGGRTLDTSELSGFDADSLAAFDGEVDYDGDSGCVLGPMGLETRLLYLDDPEDIAYFDRSRGLVPLTFTAMGESFLSAPDSLQTEVDMRVGVRVVCEYVYDR